MEFHTHGADAIDVSLREADIAHEISEVSAPRGCYMRSGIIRFIYKVNLACAPILEPHRAI